MTALLHDLLAATAARVPDRPALRRGDVTWTYAQLQARARAYARRLTELGVGRGDRVLITAPHEPETVAAIFATASVGGLYVVVGDTLPAPRLAQIVADAAPRVALCSPATAAAVRSAGVPVTLLADLPAAGPGPDAPGPIPVDPVGLLYTSGSTSTPKAVVSTHRQVLFVTAAIAARLGYRADDTVFCCLPLSFDYGLYQVFLTVAAGGELVLADEADAGPRLLSRLVATATTVLPAVPTLLTALTVLMTRARGGPPRLRLVTSSGAALPPATADRLRAGVPGLAVVSMFGLTECKRVSIMDPNEDAERPGAVGRPLPGTEAYAVDADGRRLPPGEVGELVVRGEHVMAGYWRAPELTAAKFRRDAFGQPLLYTGDRCSVDADGYLYFAGRVDDQYKQRGFRVSAVEVEAAANAVPAVRLAAVLPPAGDRGAIVVVEGDTTPAAVLRELALRIEEFKVPERCVVAALPLGPNGKVDRRALAALVDTAPVDTALVDAPAPVAAS